MKNVAILILLLTTGCHPTVPVQRHFPDVPPELTEQCPPLSNIPDGTTKLSTVLSVVTDNYSLYNHCKLKVETWNEWYTTQKKIFEGGK